MKLATFRLGDERKVGIVNDQSATVSPFELSAAEAARGIQHLIEEGPGGFQVRHLLFAGYEFEMQHVCLKPRLS